MNDGLDKIGNTYIQAMEKVTDAYRKQFKRSSPPPSQAPASPDDNYRSGLPGFVLEEYKRRLV